MSQRKRRGEEKEQGGEEERDRGERREYTVAAPVVVTVVTVVTVVYGVEGESGKGQLVSQREKGRKKLDAPHPSWWRW